MSLSNLLRRHRRRIVVCSLVVLSILTVVAVVLVVVFSVHFSSSSTLSPLLERYKFLLSPPTLNVRWNVSDEETILVAVASYRDKWCADTVFTAMTRARYPQNVFFALVDQTNRQAGDELCIDGYQRLVRTFNDGVDDLRRRLQQQQQQQSVDKNDDRNINSGNDSNSSSNDDAINNNDDARSSSSSSSNNNNNNNNNAAAIAIPDPLPDRSSQIRYRVLNYKDARGPCHARYLSSQLWNGERYYFQIDSHSTFVRDWDVLLLKNMHNCPVGPQRCVLSHHPTSVTQMGSDDGLLPYICGYYWDGDIPRFKGVLINKQQTGVDETPFPAPFLGSGMVVFSSQALVDVPYDPYLPFLFSGEELLHSARLFTNGYSLYSIIYHRYADRNDPRKSVWSDVPNYYVDQKKSIKRMEYLLGVRSDVNDLDADFARDLDRYGMGSNRSIADYWEYSKIYFPNYRNRNGDYNRAKKADETWCKFANENAFVPLWSRS